MEKVKAYFKRIGLDYPEKIVPDSELLQKLQFAHCTHVPYENLDIIRGIPLSLKTDDLYEKIVVQGRGGFCFELNGLFGWLLRELGYEVTDVAARYLRGESSIPMRRHRVLLVRAVDGTWCCDVGIGEVCPRYPLRLVEGLEQSQFDECYRFDKDPFLGWVLMDRHHGEWRQFYSFTEEPQLDVDFIAPTFYCEKHPDSPFFPDEMFSLKTAEGRITLDGNVFKEFRNGNVEVRKLSEGELSGAYRKFGLA
ncbi:MAG: arylamine N-acetyltransferase [Anaerolineaceae bacterium]|nr:arylamine N-acetyltransferase [Anaerolineaceae bacterium]